MIAARLQLHALARLDLETVEATPDTVITLTTDRSDGFDGNVKVDISGAPEGFFVSSPLVIQAGHLDAAGCLYARGDAKMGQHDFSKVKLVASANVNGKIVQRDLHRQWRVEQRPPFANPPDLALQVRPVLDRLTPDLLAVLDTRWKKIDFTFGVGKGLNAVSDRFTAKLMAEFELDD